MFRNLAGTRFGSVSKLAGIAFALTAATPARAQLVQFGDTINSPGVYFLDGNQSGSGDGITIESSDVLLFLGRFKLDGDGTGEGIRSSGYDNITIWGGRVTDFGTGIEFGEASYITVRDCRIDHNDETGIDWDDVDDSRIVRCHTDYNGENGVELEGCDNNHLFSVLSDYNGQDGIHLGFEPDSGGGCTYNKLKKCWAAYNERDGIQLLGSDYNEIEENQAPFNSRVGILLDAAEDTTKGTLGAVQDGSDYNTIEGNWCPLNSNGIVVLWGSTDNEITNNIALFNTFPTYINYVGQTQANPAAALTIISFGLTWLALLGILFVGRRPGRGVAPVAGR
jgi:parallel beta-helix repeat protein